MDRKNENGCDVLRHCSLTNLIGESAFGDLDFDFNIRRNASIHNRSATHCIKRNKTMHFLGGKSIYQRRIFLVKLEDYLELLRKL